MKNKFLRLNKNERKDAIKRFKEYNKNYYSTLFRLKIMGLLGYVYSIADFTYNFINTPSIYNYIVDAFLLIFSTIFIMVSRKYLIKNVNEFLIKEKK